MRQFISKVWIENGRVNAMTKDGTLAFYEISRWPRLASATKEQIDDFYLSYTGIHWPQLDEDLSFEGMFEECGLCIRTLNEDSVCYESGK